jgi:eukaryotic-like serine/threonine-protein kinase
MSPEQVRGQEADHRWDIFSFGVILYEMLPGRRAFSRESAIEVLNAILKVSLMILPKIRTAD